MAIFVVIAPYLSDRLGEGKGGATSGRMERMMDIAGRVLLAALFAAGTVQKALDPGAAVGLLAGFGLPGWLVWPALLFNAGVAFALVTGWRLHAVALAGAVYCMITSIFHLIPSDGWQMSIFVKNWAIAGGLLCLSARSGLKRQDRGHAPPL